MSLRRWVPVLALFVAAASSLATSREDCPDARLPLHEEEAWDPNAPLVLVFRNTYEHEPAADSPAIVSGIRIRGPEGEVPFFLVGDGRFLVVCPDGGLQPDTDYTWTVRFDSSAPNEPDPPEFEPTGEWPFHTAADPAGEPARSQADCEALAALVEEPSCWGDDRVDTADTGDSR
jgi:hypothetical protein